MTRKSTLALIAGVALLVILGVLGIHFWHLERVLEVKITPEKSVFLRVRIERALDFFPYKGKIVRYHEMWRVQSAIINNKDLITVYEFDDPRACCYLNNLEDIENRESSNPNKTVIHIGDGEYYNLEFEEQKPPYPLEIHSESSYTPVLYPSKRNVQKD